MAYEKEKLSPTHMEKRRESSRRYSKVAREWLAEYKLSHGCVDCGYRAHYAALQLDHEGEKKVSIAAARSSIARLQAEIASGECKVRCANCHAVKTWERKQPALPPTRTGEIKSGLLARYNDEKDQHERIPVEAPS